jgi:hypothetical protein
VSVSFFKEEIRKAQELVDAELDAEARAVLSERVVELTGYLELAKAQIRLEKTIAAYARRERNRSEGKQR